jgi:tetratricopeptide (TPR) repeat protein
MKIRSLVGGLCIGLLALALTGLATSASAQTGGIRGKIADEAGKAVEGATVVVDSPEGLGSVTLKTNKNGEFFSIGMRPGNYNVKATKDNLTAGLRGVHVGLGDPVNVETLTLRKGGGPGGANVSPEEAEKARKQQEALQTAFKSAQAAADAGNLDDAIAQFTKLATDAPKCMVCYLQLGTVQAKKGDQASLDAAEASYKKAIEMDPTSAEPYNALAGLYNSEKKFEQAGQMSSKAAELSGGAGGLGGDPTTIFNQGIILWNQPGKAAEAEKAFQKVTVLDPKMADAYYFLGMTLVNQAKLADAKKPFETYLQLAPTGKYADQVKGLLQLPGIK